MRWSILPFILLSALLFSSCGDDNSVISESVGSFQGDIELYDQYGDLLDNHSGVTITNEKTGESTITDSAGIWRLDNVTAGPYAVIFRKDGYSWTREQGDFYGGSYQYPLRKFSQLPTYGIDDFTVAINNDAKVVRFNGKVSGIVPDNRRRNAGVFYSFDSTFFERTDKNLVGWMDNSLVDSMEVYGAISTTLLYSRGARSNLTIFLRAYAASSMPMSYLDFHTRKFVYTNYSDSGSNIVSIVVP